MNGAAVGFSVDFVGGERDDCVFCSESVKSEVSRGGGMRIELKSVSTSASGGGDDEWPLCFVGDRPSDDVLEGLN